MCSLVRTGGPREEPGARARYGPLAKVSTEGPSPRAVTRRRSGRRSARTWAGQSRSRHGKGGICTAGRFQRAQLTFWAGASPDSCHSLIDFSPLHGCKSRSPPWLRRVLLTPVSEERREQRGFWVFLREFSEEGILKSFFTNLLRQVPCRHFYCEHGL